MDRPANDPPDRATQDLSCKQVKVWDLPTRFFHWALLVSVLGLVVTGLLGGAWMPWHSRLGYLTGSLLVFRWVWGCVGGHYSRFSRFLQGPSAIFRYLSGRGKTSRLGHNPLGALSVMAMLLLLSMQVGLGLFADDRVAFSGPLSHLVDEKTVRSLSKLHRLVGKWGIPALVCLHVMAIAYHRLRWGMRLVTAMWTGMQRSGDTPVPESKDGWHQRLLALVIWCAGLGLFWWISTKA